MQVSNLHHSVLFVRRISGWTAFYEQDRRANVSPFGYDLRTTAIRLFFTSGVDLWQSATPPPTSEEGHMAANGLLQLDFVWAQAHRHHTTRTPAGIPTLRGRVWRPKVSYTFLDPFFLLPFSQSDSGHHACRQRDPVPATLEAASLERGSTPPEIGLTVRAGTFEPDWDKLRQY